MSTEVNTALGTWSELFMLLAALVYLCVFICFAWDMASHSKTPVSYTHLTLPTTPYV